MFINIVVVPNFQTEFNFKVINDSPRSGVPIWNFDFTPSTASWKKLCRHIVQ